MRLFLKRNGLSLAFLALFVGAIVFQAIVGLAVFNEEQDRHGNPQVSFWRYVISSEFGSAVMENWQSEYLQFTLFLMATIWLIQRGSPESKEAGEEGRESEQEQLIGKHAKRKSPHWARVGGLRTALYSNSLLIAMGVIFLGSWFAHSVTSWSEYNSEQLQHHENAISWLRFAGTSHFWEQTLQNWQSEFLAVGSMVILSTYLRQRGSPESKPVGAPHDATGVEG